MSISADAAGIAGAQPLPIEIVSSGPWWEGTLLPVASIVIAAGTLIWTIWDRSKEHANLHIEARTFFTVPAIPSAPGPLVGIEVVNRGRTGRTVVQAIGFRGRGKRGTHMLLPVSVLPATLPESLEPGESITWAITLEAFLRECHANSINPAKLTPFANSGHGQFTGRWVRDQLQTVKRELAKMRSTGP
jgi:hypothetical protein